MNEFDNTHPHGPLRRKEREIVDRSEIDAILGEGKVMRIALVDGDIPFLVPVFFVYDGDAVYFHSAKVGTKMRILAKNPNICFEVSLDQGVVPADAACDFEARHRTAIGWGTAAPVEDEAEKIRILDLLVAKFTDRKFDYPQAMLSHTAVTRIEVRTLKGKKHGL